MPHNLLSEVRGLRVEVLGGKSCPYGTVELGSSGELFAHRSRGVDATWLRNSPIPRL